MAKRIKIICLTLIIFLFCGMFSGCYDRREVDDLAYVVAIGLDIGKSNFLKLTLQLAVPLASGAGGGGQSGSQGGSEGGDSNNSTNVITLETPTLYSGLNMANNFLSKQINLSHTKVIVIGEELAKEGLHKYIHAISRGKEFRPNMYVAVSRRTAEDYIRSIKPILEANPAKYYEMSFKTYEYTGFTANSAFHNFYFQQEALDRSAVAILVDTEMYKSSSEFTKENSDYKEKGRSYPLEGDYKAGDMPKVGGVQSEIMGMAIFYGDKMVGEIDGAEAVCHLMATGEYNYSYMSIPDPQKKDMFIVLNVKQSRKPRYSVDIADGKPDINLKILLEADILSIQSGIDYENNLDALETAAENFIKAEMLRYLNKTTKEFHSDVCGFGKAVKGKFLTWKEWEDFNWLAKYKDSTFNADVDVKIRRPGLMIRSIPGGPSEDNEIHK